MPRNTGRSTGASFRVVESAATQRRAQANSPFGNVYARASFDWTDVDAATLADGIAHSLSIGRSLTFSTTSDGGAVKVSVWENNTKHEAYAADSDTLNRLLEVLGPPVGDISQAAD